MIYEACIENLEFLEENIQRGANRIELCDNLAVGGTTPSYAVIHHASRITKAHGVELAVLIRPRGGNFVYNDVEKKIIRMDMEKAIGLGADKIVVGALKDGDVDYDFMEDLIGEAKAIKKDIGFHFHMAFDHIEDKEKRMMAIKKLKTLGIDTILTHGGVSGDIEDNLDTLKEYLKEAKDCDMMIMPGGGISILKNREEIIKKLQQAGELQAIHGTKIVWEE